MKLLNERIGAPAPADIRTARLAANLTQAEAALLVADVLPDRAERTWQNYEADIHKSHHRAIPLATWELFLLLTNQHPSLALAG